MPAEKLSTDQYKIAANGFLSLFSIVGIMFYGLPFFFDFWVKEFGWSRATVTSGNVLGKVIVGPLIGFAAGWGGPYVGPEDPLETQRPRRNWRRWSRLNGSNDSDSLVSNWRVHCIQRRAGPIGSDHG